MSTTANTGSANTGSANTGSKVDLAYELIRARILDGSYTPGYRLVLGTLAKELGTSTVPVREAVRRLEAESLVEVIRNVGAAVRGLDPVEYRWTAQALAIVEAAATGLAAVHLDDRAIAEARAVNAALRDGLSDLDPLRHSRLNQRFHELIYASCPNPHLLELVRREWTRMATLRSTVFSFVPERARESVDEHDTLLDLLQSRAPSTDIEALVRAHRERTVRAVLRSQSTQEGITP